MSSGPAVVAVGGGHGLACSLSAIRRYSSQVTAVVSVADDGGSSGRLREQLGIPAPGDVRKCLAALAPAGSVLAAALDHRFAGWELDGHAFGNLLVAALAATAGDFTAGVEEAGRLLGIVGRVLPATSGPVDLKAEVVGGWLEGQVLINATPGVRAVSLVPPDAEVPPAVVEAIAAADQIVIGPGSLFTSVLAACVPPPVRAAIAASPGRRVYVCNLRQQVAETAGYDAAAHLEAVRAHGIEPDVMLLDPQAMPIGELAQDWRGVVAERALADRNGLVHDPERLATALAELR